MPFLGAAILIQILCAVHCVRSGRNGMWLTVIIFLSLPGCLAYAVFEILPHYQGRREVRMAKAVAAKKLDPDRAVRAAREALDMADTAANRTALGDAFAEQDKWAEAAEAYRAALERTHGRGDRALQVKLARAELERGEAAAARDILQALPLSGSPSENDRTALLLARAYDDCGDSDSALRLYSDVGERLAGAEPQCRQAALLIRLGREAEALPLLEETQRRARRIDRFERMRDAEMYAWAERTLAELGAA
ncbi:MAG TPA: hypothetical protein VGB70_07500 [Allosphingosinicella sp.]|jgi:hypothetical protein